MEPAIVFPTPATPASPTSQPRVLKAGWGVIERDGKFQGRAWDPHTRRNVYETFATRSLASDWAKLTHAEFVTRERRAGRVPFADMADAFIKNLKRLHSSEGHVDYVEYVVAKAKEQNLGDLNDARQIRKVTETWLAGLTNRSGEPASANTQNAFLRTLKSIGEFARVRQEVKENPFEVLGYVTVVRAQKAVFTLEEVGRLVDPANADHPFFRMFAAMIYTGFRKAEALAMRYDWIRWDAMRISMLIEREARINVLKGFAPKGKRVRCARHTKLMAEFAEILTPERDGTGLLFPDYAELESKAFQRRFDGYLNDCGVEVGDRTPHSTRHTWISCMHASGANELQVKLWSGHTDKEMQEHYGAQQDLYRHQLEKAKWPPGELRFRDFAPGGRCR